MMASTEPEMVELTGQMETMHLQGQHLGLFSSWRTSDVILKTRPLQITLVMLMGVL